MNTTVKASPHQRLSAERIRRHWTQLEVADQIGTTPGNVSRWERGITSPGPYFRNKLCELFGRSAQELGLTWDESDDSPGHNTLNSSLVAASFPWDTPPRSTLFFPDREDLLAHVRTLLHPDPRTLIPESSEQGELNLPEQEHANQGGLLQAITQWIQTCPNLVLILDDVEAVVIVTPKEKVC
jgi:transcriptional regulator with XRE-family HTH domain